MASADAANHVISSDDSAVSSVLPVEENEKQGSISAAAGDNESVSSANQIMMEVEELTQEAEKKKNLESVVQNGMEEDSPMNNGDDETPETFNVPMEEDAKPDDPVVSDAQEGNTDDDLMKEDDSLMSKSGDDSLNDSEDDTSKPPEYEPDVLKLEHLSNLLEAGRDAGSVIARKNVVLLIGGTGAGKSTTALYLAGVPFERDAVKRKHFKPKLPLPNRSLEQFVVGGGSRSVTTKIHAVDIPLPNGDSITLCDTPGFGDSEGPEMDISNGLGIIHALQQAASIKPVLVLNHRTLSGDRYRPLRDTLGTVTKMLEKGVDDFSSFGYIFTRHMADEEIHEDLQDFLDENEPVLDGVFKSLLRDMIAKTKSGALAISPLKHAASSKVLEKLISTGPAMSNPTGSFVPFVSDQSKSQLKIQAALMLENVDKALRSCDIEKARVTLEQLRSLSDTLSVEFVTDAFHQGTAKISERANAMLSKLESSLQADNIVNAASSLRQLRKLAEEMPTADTSAALEKATSIAISWIRDLAIKIDSTVKAMFESEGVESYKTFGVALRRSLSLYSNAKDLDTIICDRMSRKDNAEFDQVLKRTASSLFGNNQKVSVVNASDSAPLIQLAINRHQCLCNEVFSGLLQEDMLKSQTSGLGNKISLMIRSVVAEVQSKVQLNEDMASDFGEITWEDVKNGAVFLDELRSFFDTHSNTAKISWPANQIEAAIDSLKHYLENCIEQLESAVGKLERVLDEKESWTWKTQLKCFDQGSMEFRHVLVTFVSEISLLEKLGIVTDGDNPLSILERFDQTLGSLFFPSVGDFVAVRAQELSKSTLYKDEAIVEEVKGLSQLSVALYEHCSPFHELNPGNVDELKKKLVEARACLKRFVEDASKKRGRVDPVKASDDEIAELKSTKPGMIWYKNYLELAKFQRKEGHCNVPQAPNGLGKWVNHQRNFYKDGKLSEIREVVLEKLGFEWDARAFKAEQEQELWQKNFKKLAAFHKREGHFPSRSTKSPLAIWLMHQRADFKKWCNTGQYKGETVSDEVVERRFEQLKSIDALPFAQD